MTSELVYPKGCPSVTMEYKPIGPDKETIWPPVFGKEEEDVQVKNFWLMSIRVFCVVCSILLAFLMQEGFLYC